MKNPTSPTSTTNPTNPWKKLVLNSNSIIRETEKAVLFKLPNSTNKSFWHPKKLVKMSGKGNYRVTVSYTDSFNFNIITPQGTFESSVEEFENFFSEINKV